MKRDIIYGGGGIFLGSLLAYYFAIPFYLVSIVFILGLFVFFKVDKGPSFFILALALGLGLMNIREEERLSEDIANAKIYARVLSVTSESEKKISYEAELYKINDRDESRRVFLRLSPKKDIKPYQLIEGRGDYEQIRRTGNPGLFNYYKYAKVKGISGSIRLDDVRVLERKIGFLEKIKEGFLSYVDFEMHRGLSKDNGSFMASIITNGKRSKEGLGQDLKDLGLAHVMAISGLHIGLISLLVMGLLLKLGLDRKISSIVLIILLALYLYFISFPASAIRSFTMISLLALSTILARGYDYKKALGLAVFTMVLVNPYRVFDLGLILSVLASIGLMNRDKFFHDRGGYLLETFRLALLANLFVFPILARYFNSFNIMTFLANLIILPIFSLTVDLAFIKLLLGLALPSLSFYLAGPIGVCLNLIRYFTTIMSIESTKLDLASPSYLTIGLYYFFLFAYMYRYKIRDLTRPLIEAVVKSFTLALASIYLSLIIIDPLQVDFLDIGQGDAIFIKNLRGEMMVDTGGSSFSDYSYENIVKPYIIKNSKRPVPVILSHLDLDHSGNLQLMAKDGLVKEVYGSHLLEKRGIKALKKGQKFSMGPSDFYIVFAGDGGQTSNDRSLVILLDHYGTRVLLTGDLEGYGEFRLMEDRIRADILKVSHHGSSYSTGDDFLNWLRPKEAIISAGKNNPYGHPSDDTLARLKKHGCRVYRTDEDGMVRLDANRFSYRIKKFSDKKSSSLLFIYLVLIYIASRIYFDYFKSILKIEDSASLLKNFHRS